MVFGFAQKNNRTPTWHQLKHAILRNFGGVDLQPLEVFERKLHDIDKNTQVIINVCCLTNA